MDRIDRGLTQIKTDYDPSVKKQVAA